MCAGEQHTKRPLAGVPSGCAGDQGKGPACQGFKQIEENVTSVGDGPSERRPNQEQEGDQGKRRRSPQADLAGPGGLRQEGSEGAGRRHAEVGDPAERRRAEDQREPGRTLQQRHMPAESRRPRGLLSYLHDSDN